MNKLKSPQLKLLKDEPKAFGGDLFKKRKGRAMRRPLDTRYSMHFVLRSTQARGEWSFWRHKLEIRNIIERFANKNGIQLNSMANVGNHLHLHLHLKNRHTYPCFIRAISAAIMMQVTGISRWNKKNLSRKFWDQRPFSRVVVGFKSLLVLKDYIAINQLQGEGYVRDRAQFYVAWNKRKLISTG